MVLLLNHERENELIEPVFLRKIPVQRMSQYTWLEYGS